MTWSDHIKTYYGSIQAPEVKTEGVDVLHPFLDKEVMNIVNAFYDTFYGDTNKRHVLIGINPGRLGAGMTGIPFTDPVNLAQVCGIETNLPLKHELSSRFIYKVVEAFGGPKAFFGQVYITSVCPLGFVKNGKNLNYYDIKSLQEELEAYNIEELNKQLEGVDIADTAWVLGQGKNFAYFSGLNEKYGWFKTVKPLPHPRWVMQYRSKQTDKFVADYAKIGT